MKLDIEGINKVIVEYEQDSKALKDELFRICWYLRGTPISEAYMLSYEDRVIIGKIIERNLETTKESGLPFF